MRSFSLKDVIIDLTTFENCVFEVTARKCGLMKVAADKTAAGEVAGIEVATIKIASVEYTVLETNSPEHLLSGIQPNIDFERIFIRLIFDRAADIEVRDYLSIAP